MKGLAVGQRATTTRTFSVAEITAYRALSGDEGLGFGVRAEEQTVPGPLVSGLFSYLLGTQLPGRGTNWLKQSLEFRRPAPLGRALTAAVEIVRLRPEKDLVNLRTSCVDATNEIICSGEALVLVRDLETEVAM